MSIFIMSVSSDNSADEQTLNLPTLTQLINAYDSQQQQLEYIGEQYDNLSEQCKNSTRERPELFDMLLQQLKDHEDGLER